MANQPLRFSAPFSPYRECDLELVQHVDAARPTRVLCVDVLTGKIVGSPSIVPDGDADHPVLEVEKVIGLLGGAYRFASIAVDIGTDDLTRRTRRMSDELRLRRRLWRRRKRNPRAIPELDEPHVFAE